MERQEQGDVELFKILDPTSSEFKEVIAYIIIQRRWRGKRFTYGRQKNTETYNNDDDDGGNEDAIEYIVSKKESFGVELAKIYPSSTTLAFGEGGVSFSA